jgi:glycosyltransferase involved in cell wall biosynthesis
VDLSIVVPVLNEQDSIEHFLKETIPYCEQLKINFEILFINDGSTDNTLALLIAARESYQQLKIVNLSRNFGKESAVTAGLDHTVGEAVILMDVDLQDPPELIVEFYRTYLQGYDSVIGVRRRRDGDSYLKRFFAKSFYSLFRKLSDVNTIDNAGDFRLISRRVLEVIRGMPERTRYMKGILSWPGFETALVTYDRPDRFAGNTKWGFSRLWSLALDGIFSFSTLPLKIWAYLGMSLSIVSFIYLAVVVVKTTLMGVEVPGYASILSVVLFIGGINLMGIGILGEYIGRIFVEVKGRPIYVVENFIGAPAKADGDSASN